MSSRRCLDTVLPTFLPSPMAIACSGDRAPCLRRRILRVSSCTNSPACVLGDLPARLVRLSGIEFSKKLNLCKHRMRLRPVNACICELIRLSRRRKPMVRVERIRGAHVGQ